MREAAERTRRALTDNDKAPLSVVWQNKSHEIEIGGDAFESACAPLLARLRDPVLRSLRDSEVSLDAIDEVILVGGATRMPVVRRAVTRMFGRFPSTAINPDEAVAQGAAIQAALKARDAALAEVVLTDVCPFSLGVESAQGPLNKLVSGVFTPILERNCVIPASREYPFSTLQDNQPSVRFPIYQGESHWARENIHLGDIDVPVPRGKAGQVQINCRFSYDINGLLEVDLHVPASGERRQLVIIDQEGLAPQEVEARRAALAKLKIHPRDTESISATLSRAGRCYENSLGEAREYIGDLINTFERVLARQDPRACEAARAELSAILDGIEGKALL
jgi:molecular chaperone HscC